MGVRWADDAAPAQGSAPPSPGGLVVDTVVIQYLGDCGHIVLGLVCSCCAEQMYAQGYLSDPSTTVRMASCLICSLGAACPARILQAM